MVKLLCSIFKLVHCDFLSNNYINRLLVIKPKVIDKFYRSILTLVLNIDD